MKPDDRPTAAQRGQLRAYLAKRGYTAQEANAIVNSTNTWDSLGHEIAKNMRERKPETLAMPMGMMPEPARHNWRRIALVIALIVLLIALAVAAYYLSQAEVLGMMVLPLGQLTRAGGITKQGEYEMAKKGPKSGLLGDISPSKKGPAMPKKKAPKVPGKKLPKVK